RFFCGEGTHLGEVSAIAAKTFAELCKVIGKPIPLPQTRAEFHALPKKDKEAPLDQQRAKRVRYITPAVFKTPTSQRTLENAVRCNLIALDVDTASEAKR